MKLSLLGGLFSSVGNRFEPVQIVVSVQDIVFRLDWAELQKKQNKLYEEFLEYKKHEGCYGSKCDEGEDIEKCRAIRKKFHRLFDEEL